MANTKVSQSIQTVQALDWFANRATNGKTVKVITEITGINCASLYKSAKDKGIL